MIVEKQAFYHTFSVWDIIDKHKNKRQFNGNDENFITLSEFFDAIIEKVKEQGGEIERALISSDGDDDLNLKGVVVVDLEGEDLYRFQADKMSYNELRNEYVKLRKQVEQST